MARYFDENAVTQLVGYRYSRHFEKLWKIGDKPDYAGIYECQNCYYEEVIARNCEKLPACPVCSPGQKLANMWKLLVIAQNAAKPVMKKLA